MPFDQIDWIVGALIFSLPVLEFDIMLWGYAIALFGVLHIVINYLGYVLKIKKNKF